MGCVRGVLRVWLRRGRLPFGRVFCLGFCGGVLLMSGIAHRRSSVGFVGPLRGLLFLLFLFRRFLDAGELAQNFFPFFLGLPAAGKLHGEDLLDNLIELGPASHTQRFELVGHNRKSDANRSPLVQNR